jgi:hypothetical protein
MNAKRDIISWCRDVDIGQSQSFSNATVTTVIGITDDVFSMDVLVVDPQKKTQSCVW